MLPETFYDMLDPFGDVILQKNEDGFIGAPQEVVAGWLELEKPKGIVAEYISKWKEEGRI